MPERINPKFNLVSILNPLLGCFQLNLSNYEQLDQDQAG